MDAAIAAVDPAVLMTRVGTHHEVTTALAVASAVHVIAAGKAAEPMMRGLIPFLHGRPGRRLGVSPAGLAPGLEMAWWAGGHPVPDEGSIAAGGEALRVAQGAATDALLVVLLSGGASALLALPAQGITLADKRDTVKRLLGAGATIGALNCVRKHLSSIKGGHLAASCRGAMLTLALSDVADDDVSVIGSGPGVADPSTFSEALAVLEMHEGTGAYPPAVVARLSAGVGGTVDESPKPGDPRLVRARSLVTGSARDAVDAVVAAAAQRGYRVCRRAGRVTGVARDAAVAWAAWAGRCLDADAGPVCLVSAGETTVQVRGAGRGGRNQEFTLACAQALAQARRDGRELAWASIGTDGVDGPTDAAGAIADTGTLARAAACGAQGARAALDDNNTYDYFRRLGDLVMTGPTATNVGDVQLLLAAPKD